VTWRGKAEVLAVAPLVGVGERASWKVARRYAFFLLELRELLMVDAIAQFELLHAVVFGRDVLDPLLDTKPSERHPTSALLVAPIGAVLVLCPAQLAMSTALGRVKPLGPPPEHVPRTSKEPDLEDVADGDRFLE
jgi:hypothetical protein